MSRLSSGIILIVVGLFLLLSNLGIIGNIRDWWPVILIVIGLNILLESKEN